MSADLAKDQLAEALRETLPYLRDEMDATLYVEDEDANEEVGNLFEKITKLLAAHDAQRAESGAGVDDGYVLVPRVPTLAMLNAGGRYRARGSLAGDIYTAMLAAIPEKDQREQVQP